MTDKSGDGHESRSDMRERHRREAADAGNKTPPIVRAGQIAGAVAACIGLVTMVGPWVLNLALAERDRKLEQIESVDRRLAKIEKLADEVIAASRDAFKEREIVDQRLASSIENLRTEVRLRAGAPLPESNSVFGSGAGFGSGVGSLGGGRRGGAARPARGSPASAEILNDLTQQMDENLEAVAASAKGSDRLSALSESRTPARAAAASTE